MRKKIAIIFVLATLLLSSCTYEPPFRQTLEHIVKIELVSNDYMGEMYECTFTSTILCTLTEEGATAFASELLEMVCHKKLSPVGYIGIYEVRIYYDDGNIDIIGSEANGYTKQSEMVVQGWYYYAEEDLRELFEKYTSLSKKQ